MINLSGLEKSYAGHRVLDGVTLTIDKGSFVALVGQSGAGKTTLLKSINRLVEIDAGTVLIDGADAAHTPRPQLRRRIGYVFQDVGLFPNMTVAENIWLVPKLEGRGSTGRADRVAELLDLVSLPAEIGARYPSQLSGGQAQRVGFARALAAQPSIMLMDEPFGALDPVTRSELGLAYRALHERMGLTSILVTHDLTEALLLADRIIVLAGGGVAADMPPAELFHYQGDPQITAMVDVVKAQAERLEALARPPA